MRSKCKLIMLRRLGIFVMDVAVGVDETRAQGTGTKGNSQYQTRARTELEILVRMGEEARLVNELSSDAEFSYPVAVKTAINVEFL